MEQETKKTFEVTDELKKHVSNIHKRIGLVHSILSAITYPVEHFMDPPDNWEPLLCKGFQETCELRESIQGLFDCVGIETNVEKLW